MKLPATHQAVIQVFEDLLGQARAGNVSSRELLARAEIRLRDLQTARIEEGTRSGVFARVARGREERP